MTRIHGDKKIRRRNNIESKSDYHDYLEDLKADFHNICGYCGKTTEVTKNGFEIDHFVPKKIAPEKLNDYNNLVYACYQCNRKKRDKWPTNNPSISHDENVGFIDPADEEFDMHLERDFDGYIKGKTNVGKYMVKALEFDKRPMCEIWQLLKLIQTKSDLLKMEAARPDTFNCWKEVTIKIDNLLKYMFEQKE